MRCVSARRTVDRHVLYLVEINDRYSARRWLKSIEAFDETRGTQAALATARGQRSVIKKPRIGTISLF